MNSHGLKVRTIELTVPNFDISLKSKSLSYYSIDSYMKLVIVAFDNVAMQLKSLLIERYTVKTCGQNWSTCLG